MGEAWRTLHSEATNPLGQSSGGDPKASRVTRSPHVSPKPSHSSGGGVCVQTPAYTEAKPGRSGEGQSELVSRRARGDAHAARTSLPGSHLLPIVSPGIVLSRPPTNTQQQPAGRAQAWPSDLG